MTSWIKWHYSQCSSPPGTPPYRPGRRWPEIVWKIDGIIYKTESLDKYFYRSETEENFPENGNPFDNDFIFYIQNIGLNNSGFNFSEAYVLIDYIKVYEWVTSCYSCDCGLPALPPQVIIRGYNLFYPKKYKNGQVVNFACAIDFGFDYYKEVEEEEEEDLSQYEISIDILIGSKFSVCTNGKWNKKSGVCGN